MITIEKPAQAGTLESSDALVSVAPGKSGQGVVLTIESLVDLQFGAQIRAVAEKFLAGTGIGDVTVAIKDRGALDFVLEARIETALVRAGKIER